MFLIGQCCPDHLARALVCGCALALSGVSVLAQDLRPAERTTASLKPVEEPATKITTPERKPGFVLVDSPAMVSRFKADPDRVAQGLNAGMLRWTGAGTVADAWRTLVNPGDRVGLRINTSGGNITSTHPSLVQAVVDGLRSAGIRAEDIIVWDKYPHHMISAGYVPMQPKEQWQCRAVIEGSGWDAKQFYFHEIVGRLIWGDHEFKGAALPVVTDPAVEPVADEARPRGPEQISNRSYFAHILTQEVDKVINIPALTSHPGTGIAGCLASLALGSVDNHRRFNDGSDASASAIAEILLKEPIANKTVLHILDALVVQFAGGPAFDPNFADSKGWILIGQDPVAMDSWALQQIEYRREDSKVVPIGDRARHIQAAQAFGLGQHFESVPLTPVTIP